MSIKAFAKIINVIVIFKLNEVSKFNERKDVEINQKRKKKKEKRESKV